MARRDTDLPFGDAFSPSQIDVEDGRPPLVAILDLIDEYQGQPDAFDAAVADRYFSTPDRAKNVRLGVGPEGYRIVDKNFELTDIGEELLELRDDHEALHDRFARHILLNRHGLKGIEIVEDLRAKGDRTTNGNIKEEFRKQYDFHIDESSNHWSQMRAWLAEADLVNTGTSHWNINREKINRLVGADSETILDLDDLEPHQQAFLRALALIDPDAAIKNSDVKSIAEEAYGVEISQSKISDRTLEPLREAGFIEWIPVSGKPNLVEPTEKFEAEVLHPILEDLAERTGVDRRVLRQSFSELQEDLDADSTYDKGVALETLAVKIGRLLGLEFTGWRVRGKETGGGEVDVVMDEVDVTFNRYQIQCKNTHSQIGLKEVAREVGIARLLQSNTILMIARGGVSSEARRFATRLMASENLAIVFLTGDDIDDLDGSEGALLEKMRQETRRVRQAKSLAQNDLDEADEEQDENREEEVLEQLEDEIEEVFGGSQGSLEDFDSPSE